MLTLKNITKDYRSGNETVKALKGITLSFRENEFVSILGQSGCGKTTMLNIIGGLDTYTSGDLIINGRSTKNYKDKDWDTYRNHSIGFIFQSYNLIPHQNVLSNVELALTLSGVGKEERRNRAKEVLTQVGLEDQMYKKPNQMSGGQMQRVAIARALVNDPDILLCDEPTGALDSNTSVQIMELLKTIAKDKLIIMVTHNPELANEYSNRIIKLLDGKVIDDSNPYDDKKENKRKEDTTKKPSMSFKTALSLSLNNLMTKKTRTLLISFAGSIGIIGIALILSLSNGVQNYINSVEKDTLSSYPITIEDNSMDMSVMMETMMGMNNTNNEYNDNKIHSRPMINDILESMSSKVEKNNLEAFKEYIDNDKLFKSHAKSIDYMYDLRLNVFNEKKDGSITQVSPNQLLNELGLGSAMDMRNNIMSSDALTMSNEVWKKMTSSKKMRKEQYSLVEGKWPTNYDEVVLAVDSNDEISDYVLYSLGIMEQEELVENFNKLQMQEEIETKKAPSYTKEELLNTQFKMVLNTDFYVNRNGIWMDMHENEEFVKELAKKGTPIKIVGIIKPKEGALSHHEMGAIYYTEALEKYVIQEVENKEIVKQQKANEKMNIFTGSEFGSNKKLDMNALTPEQKMMLASLTQEELTQYIASYSESMNTTYESNLNKLGAINLKTPSSINIYANSFEDKEVIASLINEYNETQEKDGKEGNVISYNDIVGTMMESVTTIIDMISYVLIAFVSVSLIVSSIMIGIITYISVLERTKEIGVLRSIGASKKDISHVFNAEAFIIGLTSGLMGILVTVLLNVPISLVVENMTGISNIASLPILGGVILVIISLTLTTIAGLIPSRIASKKDPVEALRTE